MAVALAALLSMSLLAAGPEVMADTLSDSPRGQNAEGVAPIIVLLDVSGSMNDDDGGGVAKLLGAKAAVRQIVGSLDGATVFGLWTFPDTGCDGGGYVSQPAPLSDRSEVMRSVDGITADNDTPTGVALRSLADDLTQRGYNAATIVLVSDGESTCGPPPCDVANELVDEGFSVTVPTIGFRTSDEGARELACISQATGARTFAAEDSSELAEQLGSLVQARLEMTIRYDATPIPGSSTRITAVVRHLGGEEARDVRIALIFSDETGPRAAIPPVIRIGNIPVGATVERTWTVGTGPRDAVTKTKFAMSAWGANARRALAEGEFTTTTPRYTKDELGPLFSQISDDAPLVVFGDSYSSGEGTVDYMKTPNGVSEKCHRSKDTYLGSVFSETEMTIVACSGAVMSALTGKSDRSVLSQVQEMDSLGIVPGAGILSFGGNDIGFAEVVTYCINPLSEAHAGCAFPDYANAKIREAESIDYRLATTYRTAWSALNTPELREKRNGAYVPLFVMPYPKVTHDPRRGGCHQFTIAELVVADALGTSLNNSIEAAVAQANAQGYEIYYIADVEDAVRPDHTLCNIFNEAFIHGFIPSVTDFPAAPESVHPKKSGYLAETDAIIRWSGGAAPLEPSVMDEVIEMNLKDVAPPIEISWPAPVDVNNPSLDMLFVRGGAIAPQSTGNMPGTPVTYSLHSDPVVLGTLVADENGVAAGTLLIPTYATVGQHELVVTGIGDDGVFRERRIPVSVIEPTPFWVWAALAASILTLVAGAVFVLIGLARRSLATRNA
jgi:hypothetical protein